MHSAMRSSPDLSGSPGRLTVILLLASLVAVGSCADGPSPMELPEEGSRVHLAVNPQFHPALTTTNAVEIDKIRIVAKAATGEEVANEVFDVVSSASSWTLDVELELPAGVNPQITLTIELLNSAGGVEWSGQAGPFSVTPGGSSTVTNVTIVRGPLDNLSVTSVTISGAPSLMRAGESAQLSASAAGSSGTPEIFWASLSSGVATVSGTGNGQSATVQAVSPGTVRIVATAGSAADTVEIEVRAAVAGVMIDPVQATARSLEEDLTFTAQVLDSSGNPIAGETVTWSTADGTILENRGGGVFRTKAEGTTTVTATSASNNTFTATAQVTVQQVATSVEVTPTGHTFTALGEEQQFSATAYDANGQTMAAALFLWTTSDQDVVSVDDNGLVTSEGTGTADVIAEAATASAVSGAPAALQGTGVTGSTSVTVDQEPSTVAVHPSQATINGPGNTRDFTATALDANGHEVAGTTFGWSSSDEGVATIDDQGTATSVASGTTTITAEARKNGAATGVTGTATLEVTETILNVSVDPTEATLTRPGETVTLEASTVDQNGDPVTNVTYAWSSDDEEVATVDQEGVVTAVGEGVADITVTGSLAQASAAGDGPSRSDGPTATATITVDFMTPDNYFPLGLGDTWSYRETYDYGETAPLNGGPANTNTTITTDQIVAVGLPLFNLLWAQACGNGVLSYWLGDGSGCANYHADSEQVLAAGTDGSWGPKTLLKAPLEAGTSWTESGMITSPAEFENSSWQDQFQIIQILASMTVEGQIYQQVVHLQIIRYYNGNPDARWMIYFAPGVGIIRMETAWAESDGTWRTYLTNDLISYRAGSGSALTPDLQGATGGSHGFDRPKPPRPHSFFGTGHRDSGPGGGGGEGSR